MQLSLSPAASVSLALVGLRMAHTESFSLLQTLNFVFLISVAHESDQMLCWWKSWRCVGNVVGASSTCTVSRDAVSVRISDSSTETCVCSFCCFCCCFDDWFWCELTAGIISDDLVKDARRTRRV